MLVIGQSGGTHRKNDRIRLIRLITLKWSDPEVLSVQSSARVDEYEPRFSGPDSYNLLTKDVGIRYDE